MYTSSQFFPFWVMTAIVIIGSSLVWSTFWVLMIKYQYLG